ncbi:MAG: response regulator [Chitinivibrionales bacterium]|nr:response regulator [Chitinivibrionales bacterium]
MTMRASPSVLIVEDEAAMVMALKARLRADGFSVCGTVSTREKAVSSAIENSPDFIVMDIRLSGRSDGIEAAKEITDKIHTSIIFVTGYSEGSIKRKAMRVNPVAYMVKPFPISELISIMNRCR